MISYSTKFQNNYVNKGVKKNSLYKWIFPTGFMIWNYLTCVHLAPITSLIYSALIVMMRWNDPVWTKWIRLCTGLIDFIFTIRIYIGFHLSYKDPETGILVTNFGMIGKKKSLKAVNNYTKTN